MSVLTEAREDLLNGNRLNELQLLIAHGSRLSHPARAIALGLAELYDDKWRNVQVSIKELADRLGMSVELVRQGLANITSSGEWEARSDDSDDGNDDITRIYVPRWLLLEGHLNQRIEFLSLRDLHFPDFDTDPWQDGGWVEE